MHGGTVVSSCSITIPTLAGQTRGDIAQAIVSAVHAPGIPGPHRDCPSDRNPRDIANRNGALVSVLARALELRTTDPKIGFDLRAAELANAHPVADAGGDFAVAAGAPAVLDGSRSFDPDSTPGTHDDIAQFEWLDVTTGTPRLLYGGDRGERRAFSPHRGEKAFREELHLCERQPAYGRPAPVDHEVRSRRRRGRFLWVVVLVRSLVRRSVVAA